MKASSESGLCAMEISRIELRTADSDCLVLTETRILSTKNKFLKAMSSSRRHVVLDRIPWRLLQQPQPSVRRRAEREALQARMRISSNSTHRLRAPTP